MRSFFFYLFNLTLLKKGNYILPFKIYNRCNISIDKTASITLNSRITIGSNIAPSYAPNTTSIILKEKANAIFGNSVFIGGGVLVYVKEGAIFEFGANSYITSDTHIECANYIRIGEDCAISWGVTMIDDDHHVIQYNKNPSSDKKLSIEIDDKVWIGCNATILKGTKIGANSVVAAGSVVKGEFPENVLIAGNPARIVKQNVSWK